MTRPGKVVLVALWCKAAAWRYVVIGACACTLLALVFPPRLSPGRSSYTRPQPLGNAAGGPVAPPIPTGQASAPRSAAATTGPAPTTSSNPGATAAPGPAVPKIKPGAPIEEVEETAASPGLQAELVGEVKADTPVGGRINPSQSIAPSVHRIRPGALVEHADELPPPPAR
jgi:hypothetical protein